MSLPAVVIIKERRCNKKKPYIDIFTDNNDLDIFKNKIKHFQHVFVSSPVCNSVVRLFFCYSSQLILLKLNI